MKAELNPCQSCREKPHYIKTAHMVLCLNKKCKDFGKAKDPEKWQAQPLVAT